MSNEELMSKYIMLDKQVSVHDEQIKFLYNQSEERSKLVNSVHQLAINTELLAHEQKSLSEKVGALSKDVIDLKSKPIKRWESIVGTIITVIVTALMTYVLTQIGLK